MLFAATTMIGCKGGQTSGKYAPGTAAKVLSVEMTDLRPAIAARLEGGDRPRWVTTARWARVRALYAAYDTAPLWLEEGGVGDRAGALLDALRAAPDHGLDTTAYPISAIQQVVDAKRLTDTASAATLANADVLLTSAYVAYASDMLIGQVDPKTISQAWHIPADVRELDTAIVRRIASKEIRAAIDSMAPQYPDYVALKTAYARYRRIAASGGWEPISAASGGARNAAIRSRLALELDGDSASTSHTRGVDSLPTVNVTARIDSTKVRRKVGAQSSEPQDVQLRQMLSEYQERHGLAKTGRVDAPTLAALNVTAGDRAKQIAANLERHRWLPRSLGSRYIFVNVPSFRLDAYDDGQKSLTMKVVVGQEFEGKVTPVFSDSMETVVFRPYWNITPDIQSLEIGPKVSSDPDYLVRNDMEYYKDGSTTRIRQKPGPKNSLGLVKFLFPNDFNIYLHDTPAKELFARPDRAASHGCIRLAKPAEMAQWVLGWDADRVRDAMEASADNQSVKVPKKIPVYIVYFTAYIRDGLLYFGDDVYNRDEQLEEKVLMTPQS